MKRTYLGLAGAALGTVLMAGTATAAQFTFDFSGGNTATDGANGNTRSFTSGILSLDAQAFFLTSAGDTGADGAYLGHYDQGLGVTNDNEGSGDGFTHTVDNGGSFDYVRFIFNQNVTVLSVVLRGFDCDDSDGGGAGTCDTDFTYNFGDSLTDPKFNQQASGGVNTDINAVLGTTGENDVFRLFAHLTDTSDDRDDDFKIKSLTVEFNPPTVPEPATLALFGAALAGLGLARRRRS